MHTNTGLRVQLFLNNAMKPGSTCHLELMLAKPANHHLTGQATR